ncbi:hypothetical protein CR205_09945 [Alteribacter lacisalsi]|uniref:ATP-grasp domain-containing protein n=1 Tax=Alteribacter lacisalsi TaxID=2045244 RepID=A0A2W0HYJ8_9BACI|nr:YheC/YheD family protein [Alteribacter lacisalsi]PYZ98868.1 hypothetical protein CR205_09945 [Alteribacter lacisalsi]
MIIHFDQEKQAWYTESQEEGLTLGTLPLLPAGEKPLTEGTVFLTGMRGNEAGPVIAVLTGGHPSKPFSGDELLYRTLHEEACAQGGVVAVVPISDISGIDSMTGYVHLENGGWTPVPIGSPHVIYNRVPARKVEKSEAFLTIRQAARDAEIPFFNEAFLTKLIIDKTLRGDPELAEFLPCTEKLESREQFMRWAKSRDAFLLKISSGSRGRGIYLIKKSASGFLSLQSRKGTLAPVSAKGCWRFIESAISSRTFLLQDYIALKQHQGRKFDFRLLLHQNQNGWMCSGVGIRQAGQGQVTTHSMYGGDLLTPENTDIDPAPVIELALRAASLFSPSFTELSMDIGCDEHNRLWLFDINSKPMIFDEHAIRLKGASNLLSICHEKAGFA